MQIQQSNFRRPPLPPLKGPLIHRENKKKTTLELLGPEFVLSLKKQMSETNQKNNVEISQEFEIKSLEFKTQLRHQIPKKECPLSLDPIGCEKIDDTLFYGHWNEDNNFVKDGFYAVKASRSQKDKFIYLLYTKTIFEELLKTNNAIDPQTRIPLTHTNTFYVSTTGNVQKCKKLIPKAPLQIDRLQAQQAQRRPIRQNNLMPAENRRPPKKSFTSKFLTTFAIGGFIAGVTLFSFGFSLIGLGVILAPITIKFYHYIYHDKT